MDVAQLSTSLSQMKFAQELSVRVTKLVMDTASVQADGMVKALENSVQPHLGGNIDIKV